MKVLKIKVKVKDIAKKIDQRQFDAMVTELTWRVNGGCGNLLDQIRELDEALEQFTPLIRNSARAGVVDQWARDAVAQMLREAK